jgi:RNA polymerase sigma-70 factor, ECF subfamily
VTTPPPANVDSLVARYLPALRAFVRVRMGAELRAKEESSDIVQSVAREILQFSERFQHGGESGFRDWLFTTAHRKVVDHLQHWRTQKRQQKRDVELPEELAGLVATPSKHASAREDLLAVERAFDALSAEQREVVTCSRLLGLSHTEIATRLGKSEVAVRKTLSRALARLSAVLAADNGGAAGSPEA